MLIWTISLFIHKVARPLTTYQDLWYSSKSLFGKRHTAQTLEKSVNGRYTHPQDGYPAPISLLSLRKLPKDPLFYFLVIITLVGQGSLWVFVRKMCPRRLFWAVRSRQLGPLWVYGGRFVEWLELGELVKAKIPIPYGMGSNA
jgi:hypothetical protein